MTDPTTIDWDAEEHSGIDPVGKHPIDFRTRRYPLTKTRSVP